MKFNSCNTCAAHLTALLLMFPGITLAHGDGDHIQVRASDVRASEFGVNGELTPAPVGVNDLKFREFFRLPIGPRGLEPSERLRALEGKRVRLVGYMADREEPATGFFILTPLPVSIAEAEDGPADDMPASVAYVHLVGLADRKLPYMPGLLQFTGTLGVGANEESDGRVSTVRLQLDDSTSHALVRLGDKAMPAQH